jgi:2-methylcitrate dehydratase PrpD
MNKSEHIASVVADSAPAEASITGVQSRPPHAHSKRSAAPAGGGLEDRITATLAEYVVSSRVEDIPDTVLHEAVEIALSGLRDFSAGQNAVLLGRSERLDPMNAALINGISSIVLDYDATQYKKTNIHPSGPVLPPLFALSAIRRLTGLEFLHAYLLGVEIECRLANGLFGSHNPGWHVTGAVGPVGAAAAAGRILGLNPLQMASAFGIAATQAGGLREMYGSMCKSFTPGRAAQNGLLAASFAQRGFSSADKPIEGKKGLAQVLTGHAAPASTLDNLGQEFEISFNAHKPFACAIVCHAVIDGCLRLLGDHPFAPSDINRVELKVSPATVELAGNPEPRTGLESKFSVQHAAALALHYGEVNPGHFVDSLARNAQIVNLRGKVITEAKASLKKDQAQVDVVLHDERRLSCFVEHALGSLENPMSDSDLEKKVHGLIDPALSRDQAASIIATCWEISTLVDVNTLARATVPRHPAGS